MEKIQKKFKVFGKFQRLISCFMSASDITKAIGCSKFGEKACEDGIMWGSSQHYTYRYDDYDYTSTIGIIHKERRDRQENQLSIYFSQYVIGTLY